jgi:N-acetylmuramoyl-L-alanine amidase
VFDLNERYAGHRVFHLQNPFRIVADLYRDRRSSTPDVAAHRTPEPDYFGRRPVRRVVIDAGHGGRDPGALGPGSRREKTVVLRIANELGRILEREGFSVRMTRKDDRFVPLVARTDLANSYDGDVFISIHANASPNRRAQGVETYLLDHLRYDRQALRVAARENGTTVAQVGELQQILASLRLGDTEDHAARLARAVHGSLIGRLRGSYPSTRDLGVKRGPFLVLFHADMASVLVEVGFMTNRSEVKRINSTRFARAAAEGIARGLIAYRDQHARLIARR